MIDARLLPIQRAVLEPPARAIARLGVSADMISLAGVIVAALAFFALAAGHWGTALALIAANRLLDGLDGAVARILGPTDRGAFLDITLDYVFYALVPLGFAVQNPEEFALPAAVLIASFIATGSSFLAFAIICAKRGMKAEDFPEKGFYYAGGLAEGFETIVVFVVMCLLPAQFALIAYTFAAVCGVTAAARWARGWAAFSSAPPSAERRDGG
jgi:phosphatidylglycerophosphate synthase